MSINIHKSQQRKNQTSKEIGTSFKIVTSNYRGLSIFNNIQFQTDSRTDTFSFRMWDALKNKQKPPLWLLLLLQKNVFICLVCLSTHKITLGEFSNNLFCNKPNSVERTSRNYILMFCSRYSLVSRILFWV